jgi:peptidoglycan/LPS O-acetylase OafA/YrhL
MAATEHINPQRSWMRLDGVDLLRGLAILFVLMNHVNMRLLGARIPYTKGFPSQFVDSLVWNGQFGVQMFFAISGFLITSTTLRRWGALAAISVRDFYLLRFARIAPLLLLLLAILSTLHLAHITSFVVSPKTGGLGRALFAALTFHVNLLEARRGYLPAAWDILWSLSVEETFYLFFPLLCRLLGRGKLLTIVLFAFVIIGPFARARAFNPNPVWREYSYLGGMDAIALGCLTALFAARTRLGRSSLRIVGRLGIAILIFILCFSDHVKRWGLGRNGLSMSILSVGTCMVILAAAQSQWKSPRLLTPLRKLGQRSYEIYLTHIFLVIPLFTLFTLFLVAGKPMPAIPALFLSVILLAPILGELIARLYSEPLNRILRSKFGDSPSRLGSAIDIAHPTDLVESPHLILHPFEKKV